VATVNKQDLAIRVFTFQFKTIKISQGGEASINADFEPCDLACICRFCRIAGDALQARTCLCIPLLLSAPLRGVKNTDVSRSMQSAEANNTIACFMSPRGARDRSMAAYLVGAFMAISTGNILPTFKDNNLISVMQCNMTAEQAFEPFSGISPYPFDDFKDSAHPDSRPLTLVRSIHAD
jgi:hypothetical protein